MRLRKSLLGIGLAIIAVTLLSSCSSNNSETIETSPSKPEALMVVSQVGGKCAEEVCETSFTVYADGTTSDAEIDFDVTPLVKAIEESNLRKSSIDPNGFCQSYVDGRDLTIQIPAWGEEVYAPCKFIGGADDPLTIVAQDMFYKLNREIT